ncbi:HEAT repeat domain-containing protein [Nonomuraea sediminis]|uniref:HEAT repeat domain-containing protein n=1 Tax=Nonomuraea sediminis TaxID=2835864 RepID=UPI001BDC120B|nr:hypothetical protein [Nonomuraea sediminis]
MIDARSVIESTDWSGLHHAYGDASDAPDALLALLSEDPESCGEALGYLDAAVLHQGSIYPVTAPAARFIAGILGDERTLVLCESALPWDDRERPLRAALLEWLGSVAESVSFWDDEDDEEPEEDEDEDAHSVAACRAILRDLYSAVLPFLDDQDSTVRQAAVGAMGHLMLAPELAEFRGEQAERMERLAHHSSVAERAAAALTLGNWDLAPQAFLNDPDPSVRAAAALAPALDEDPAALAEIRHALTDPAAADDWFHEHVPQMEGKFRFALIAALLRRTRDIGEILPEALAVARMTNAYTVESDWGPLLKRAFPEPYISGTPLTTAQRQFLSAIVANDECWGNIANPILWFREAGLPHERASLRALVSKA